MLDGGGMSLLRTREGFEMGKQIDVRSDALWLLDIIRAAVEHAIRELAPSDKAPDVFDWSFLNIKGLGDRFLRFQSSFRSRVCAMYAGGGVSCLVRGGVTHAAIDSKGGNWELDIHINDLSGILQPWSSGPMLLQWNDIPSSHGRLNIVVRCWVRPVQQIQ